LPFAVFGAVLTVVAVLCWLMHTLNDWSDRRVPPYRRDIEATYASFHRFLSAIRCAALRSVE
jgi:hypothetical protein